MQIFTLKDSNGALLMVWDEHPSIVVLPNGDQVCGMKPGDQVNGFILSEEDDPKKTKRLTLEERVERLEALLKSNESPLDT
jgi:hypothetical protein